MNATNPARAALTNAVNKAIAEGAPVYENVPAAHVYGAGYSESSLCVVCGKDADFTVGWLAPTRWDAREETADIRPACSSACAFKVQRKGGAR